MANHDRDVAVNEGPRGLLRRFRGAAVVGLDDDNPLAGSATLGVEALGRQSCCTQNVGADKSFRSPRRRRDANEDVSERRTCAEGGESESKQKVTQPGHAGRPTSA